MTKSSYSIIGSGLFALDIVLDSRGRHVYSGLGGSAGNVLAILGALGWSSLPVGQLGNDKAGRRLTEEFATLNADLHYLGIEQTTTTPVVYQQLLGREEKKTHTFSFSCPVCGVKRSPTTTLAAGHIVNTISTNERANVLYFDRPTALAVELAEQCRENGTLVFFEPSTIGQDQDLFCRALKAAHIVKYADDRLDDLENFPTGDVAVEICTMGDAGLRYRAPSLENSWVHLDSFRAPWVVDTAGAGDWCTAGMLYHLFVEDEITDINRLNYNKLHSALRFGQALSALNCMTLGARGLAKSLPPKKITQAAHHVKNIRPYNKNGHDALAEQNLLAAELSRAPLKRVTGSSLNSNLICCDALF